MRINDVDFILIPEWLSGTENSPVDEDLWIARWHRNFATATWLDVEDLAPAEALLRQTTLADRPVIVVTHGRGIDPLIQAGPQLGSRPVVGAFIVAPSPVFHNNQCNIRDLCRLDFSTAIISSDDHPEFQPDLAEAMAEQLGGHFVSAGNSGRIDQPPGKGPGLKGSCGLVGS